MRLLTMLFERAMETFLRIIERQWNGMVDSLENREKLVREMESYLKLMRVRAAEIRIEGREGNSLVGSLYVPHEQKFKYFTFKVPIKQYATN